MYCWYCGTFTAHSLNRKLSFRAICDKCGSALHCCQNCKYYKPGLANDCAVPGTDYIADRTTNNFCEEFSVLNKAPSLPNKNPKKEFNNLFKED